MPEISTRAVIGTSQSQLPLPSISVVVPVHTDESRLTELVSRVARALAEHHYEILLIDDRGPLDVWDEIVELAQECPQLVGIRLGRNSGQHNALLAGIHHALYDVVVTIDDDLQNPPEEIPVLLSALTKSVDVVYGVPEVVRQVLWRRMLSSVGRYLIAQALGAASASNLTSFRAFRTRLRDGFATDVGPFVSIDALLAWSTDRFAIVTVEHHPRKHGTSNYSPLRMLRIGLDTATSFSSRPLQLSTTLGFLASLLGVVLLLIVVVRTLFWSVQVPGFAFLASAITFFAGVQLLGLGIIGEYLSRMHFRVMKRPSYVISAKAKNPS